MKQVGGDKMQESLLRWYGHVKRRLSDYVGNLALQLPSLVEGLQEAPKRDGGM